jgi:hypothetical protein
VIGASLSDPIQKTRRLPLPGQGIKCKGILCTLPDANFCIAGGPLM